MKVNSISFIIPIGNQYCLSTNQKILSLYETDFI